MKFRMGDLCGFAIGEVMVKTYLGLGLKIPCWLRVMGREDGGGASFVGIMGRMPRRGGGVQGEH